LILCTFSCGPYRHRRAVELLLDRFANSNAVMATTGPPACIPRHTGAGAALLADSMKRARVTRKLSGSAPK